MERQTETNILFLDACRDNPLARNLARSMGTRSVEVARGLARVEAGVGTLISFSTQPGNVALDGDGRNSPYTGALVKHLTAAKEDLSAILIDVRNDVMQETRNKQVPWEHVALRARFYFGTPRAPHGSGPAGPAPAQTGAALEWARVDKSSPAELETFRRRHPSSPEAEYALARIEALRRADEKKVAVVPPPEFRPTTPNPTVPAAGSPPPHPAPNSGRILASLAGTWRGVYAYANAGQRAVEFTLTLDVYGNMCRGRTEEPNTFGHRTAPKLFANVECSVMVGTGPPRWTMRKVYDGTGGQSHGVSYTGEISSDGRSISGTWTLGGAPGRFSMTKQPSGAPPAASR
jgi:hypothetical protein